MPIPSPSKQQARALWFSATMFAVCLSLTLIGLICWGAAWAIGQLSSILLPLAVAGILAFLLDPAVDFFQKKGIPRTRAIILVFFIAFILALTLAATVVPQIIVELGGLIDKFTEQNKDGELQIYLDLKEKFGGWLAAHGETVRKAWDEKLSVRAEEWLTNATPVVTAWIGKQLSALLSYVGLAIGLALVPVYLFYFLLEKRGIKDNWADYLPVSESRLKKEVVFVIGEINERLVVFFRSQVLVAMCVGGLLIVGYKLVGLNYAFILGVLAGILGIIPYLGVMLSILPALVLSLVQFGDWLHPCLILLVFVLVQMAESLFISPKIIGDRVGLHPLTVIIAVMVGTTLLGGIVGGLLAIPLTATLRTLMFRYVWVNRSEKVVGDKEE